MSAANLNIMDLGIANAFTDLAAHISSTTDHPQLARAAHGSYDGDGTTKVIATGSPVFDPYYAVLSKTSGGLFYWVLVVGATSNLNLYPSGTQPVITLTTGGISVVGVDGNALGTTYYWAAWGA